MTNMPEQISRLIGLVETAARGVVDMTPEAILKIGTFLQYLAITEVVTGLIVVVISSILCVFFWRKTRDYYNKYHDIEFPSFIIPGFFFIVAFGFAVTNFPSKAAIVSSISHETALMMTIHKAVTDRPSNNR